ncbi:HEC/Ndc80p family-domain-containing protein [Cyathus striatus]|nr:HEC/Ndc80p family-domain-containing protein [Cyathus striatus]
MDHKRRSTMQPVIDPLGNARSGIPLPSTVKKATPSSSFRMSLAGPALRSYPVPPGTNPRQSIMRSQNINPLLQSTTNPNYGRTPLNHSTRRVSVWGGNTVLAPPIGSQTVKDSRPLRDRQYQTKMRQDILSYLQSSGYDINMSILTNIQGKDYRAIFDFLVLRLDPCHPLNPSTRFEDQFVPALKALRYPFSHQIDNKWLAAPASMHSWPSLLGVLHWLVELCKMRDEYLCSAHPTLQDPVGVPDEFEDARDHKALAFNYCDEAYTEWLDMKDDFDVPNQKLESRYTRKNEHVQHDLEEQTNQLHLAKAEYTKLKSSAPPLATLQEQNGKLLKDTEKFQTILQRYEGKKKKLLDSIAYERAELGTQEEHLEQLRSEHVKLTDVVKTQNLTPEEVIRMNTEHETLSRNLEDLKEKITEAHKIVMGLEVSVTNRIAAAEEALDAYTNLLSSLELFPPLPAPWEDIDLTLELNSATSNLLQLLTGADARKVVKPTLSKVAESKRVERASLESERIRVEYEIDEVQAECENLEMEVSEIEKKAAGLNEQADDLRDAAQQEAMVANGEAARLERDLAHARTAAKANGMGVKSRLQALQFNYGEQVEKVNRLKEDTVRAIIRNSHDIAMFKEEVSRHLKELRDFADTD